VLGEGEGRGVSVFLGSSWGRGGLLGVM